MIYPKSGVGIDGFMNLNILVPALPWSRWVNMSFLVAGPVFFTKDEQVQGGVWVLTLDNIPTTTGIPDAFDDGTGILGFWRFFFDIDDKPGNLLFVAGGSTRAYHRFEETSFGWDPGPFSRLLEVSEDKDKGVWSAAILWEQVLWKKPENDKQNLRLFTGVSVSDGDPSFSKVAGMVSLESMGLLFNREKDRAGIGGFYYKLSSDMKKSMDRIDVNLRDLWGTELYYNAEITPWFHLTGDLQIVQNENGDDDPAIIVGLRAVIDL
jgi:porin